MRLQLAVFLFASFSSLANPTQAQQTLAPRDPQAMNLLALSFAAMGGSKLPGIRDTDIRAQVIRPRMGGAIPFAVRIRTLGTKKLRVDADSPEGPVVVWVNGKRAARKVAANEAETFSSLSMGGVGVVQVPVFSVLTEWNDAATSLKYIGLENSVSASLHHIRVMPNADADVPLELRTPLDVYLDAQSLLVAKLVYPARPPSNLRQSVPVEVSYSDYRAVSGLLIPLHVTYSLRGQIISEYRITSVAVNQGVREEEFEVR